MISTAESSTLDLCIPVPASDWTVLRRSKIIILNSFLGGGIPVYQVHPLTIILPGQQRYPCVMDTHLLSTSKNVYGFFRNLSQGFPYLVHPSAISVSRQFLEQPLVCILIPLALAPHMSGPSSSVRSYLSLSVISSVLSGQPCIKQVRTHTHHFFLGCNTFYISHPPLQQSENL